MLLFTLLAASLVSSVAKPYNLDEFPTNTIECDPDASRCGPNAQCLPLGPNSTYVCNCNSTYATPGSFALSNMTNDLLICSAKRKSRSTALALTIVVSVTGAGAFYLGWNDYGISVLILSLFGCCVPCLAICMVGFSAQTDEDKIKASNGIVVQCARLIAATFGCTVCGLWIAIIVYQATSACIDSSGIRCH